MGINIIYNRNKINENNVESVCTIMKRNYQYMREKARIVFGMNDEKDIESLDPIFKKLRPYSPFKLSEMLEPNFNPGKARSFTANTKMRYIPIPKQLSPKQIKEYYMYNKIYNEYIKSEEKTSKSPFTLTRRTGRNFQVI